MARTQFTATIGAAQTAEGTWPSSTAGHSGGPPLGNLTADLATLVTDQATYVTDAATFAATLATLVADGASPTQAHVTAANSAYTTLAADWAAIVAVNALVAADGVTAAAGYTQDVVLDINLAKITGIGKLRSVLNQLLRAALGSSIVPNS